MNIIARSPVILPQWLGVRAHEERRRKTEGAGSVQLEEEILPIQ